jgi:hypothetical protein
MFDNCLKLIGRPYAKSYRLRIDYEE